jgi:hypothetical protein
MAQMKMAAIYSLEPTRFIAAVMHYLLSNHLIFIFFRNATTDSVNKERSF